MSRTLTIILHDLDESSYLSPDNSSAILFDYNRLKVHRAEIEAKMRELREFLQRHGRLTYPEWHCRRCGLDWIGRILPRPPRVCPRCGSIGWQEDPARKGARKPSDPPSPRWGQRRLGRRSANETTGDNAKENTPIKIDLVPPVVVPRSDGPLVISPPPRFIPTAPAAPMLVPSQDVRFGEGAPATTESEVDALALLNKVKEEETPT